MALVVNKVAPTMNAAIQLRNFMCAPLGGFLVQSKTIAGLGQH